MTSDSTQPDEESAADLDGDVADPDEQDVGGDRATDDEEQTPWGTTSFAVGHHIGLVGEKMIALIGADDSETRQTLWELVVSDATIAHVLDRLSVGGLAALPDFVIVRFDDVLTAVLRGGVLLELIHQDDEVEVIDASGVSTWREYVVPAGVRALEVRLGEATDGQDFAVLAGSVPASSLRRNLAAADSLADSASGRWGSGQQKVSTAVEAKMGSASTSVPDPAREDEAAVPVRVAGQMSPDGVRGDPDGADEAESSSLQTSLDEDLGEADPSEPDEGVLVDASPLQSAAETSTEDGSVSEIHDEEVGGAAVRAPEATMGVPRDAGAAPAPDPLQTISGDAYEASRKQELESRAEGSNYDFIYGHTVHRSVEGAAVRVDEETEDGGLISAVPGGPLPQVAGEPSPEREGDHDGFTVSRSQLEELQQTAASVAVAGAVAAVLCPSGHPNPVHSPTCRVCQLGIVSTQPVSVPRPALAELVFTTGERAMLDKSVLIGRNPKVSGTVEGEFPHLVKFDQHGQGLSRTHAEVTIEGWQMLVTDLHSTNGTEVTLPGQSSRRLHPGEPVAVEIGTLIDFGDGIRCTVEPVR